MIDEGPGDPVCQPMIAHATGSAFHLNYEIVTQGKEILLREQPTVGNPLR